MSNSPIAFPRGPKSSSAQRGAALLAAMLTVALVATFAAAAVWQQWRTVEVEGAERQRAQAAWLLLGALDWSRVILSEDMRASGSQAVDHLAEPWAVPLQEVRLSSFLAALPDGTGNSGPEEEAWAQQVLLSGHITDLQGRLNVTNLLQGEQLEPRTLQAFQSLFDVLGVPATQLSVLTQGLLAAQRKEDSAPLTPQRVAQLIWLGLSPQVLQQLAPHITVLPERTALNLNTATLPALYASVPGLSWADAQRLVQRRERQYWGSVEAFETAWGRTLSTHDGFGVRTRYFEVLGRLRMPQTTLQERSLVQRDGMEVKVLWRESGSLQ